MVGKATGKETTQQGYGEQSSEKNNVAPTGVLQKWKKQGEGKREQLLNIHLQKKMYEAGIRRLRNIVQQTSGRLF